MKDEELFEHPLLKIPENQKPERIDVYISRHIPAFSRSKIKNLCEEKKILVNAQPVKANYIIKSSDTISLLSRWSAFGEHKAAKPIQLEILYEDDDLIIINKQSGIAVHPGLGDYQNTLENALNYHLQEGGQECKEIKVVHRLDKYTTGVMVFAKRNQAQEILQKQFAESTSKRVYHALVTGAPGLKEGRIESFIGRHPDNERLIMVSEDKSFGKNSITHYKTIETFPPFASLVECRLETGRTHQIRIHMQWIGHALLNDERYPSAPDIIPPKLREQLLEIYRYYPLHAGTLKFHHPVTQKPMEFSVPFPKAFSELLQLLRSLTMNTLPL